MANVSSIKLPDGNTYDIIDKTSGYITGMTILSYGSSTWAEFLEAYNSNKVVYCRASSNSNPATGAQGRLAFMAYINNATAPTEVEFQYYRSVSSHSDSQQGDQVYVYKLNSSSTWSVTVREAYTKIAVDGDLTKSYSNGTLTLSVTLPDTSSFITTETDPIFSASPAAGISSNDINNWNNANSLAWNSVSKELRVSKSGVATTVLSRTDLDIPTVPTNVSSFTNDAGYLTSHQNIKTINSTSMIGTGDVSVQPTLVSGTNIKTINGTSVLGSGDITISAGGTPTAYTVVLTVAGWSNNSQTVTATGVTSGNSIIVTPAPTSMDDYAGANVICTTQGTNSLTFTCENVPDESITVNILIFDGDYSAYYVGSSVPASTLGSNGDIYLRS